MSGELPMQPTRWSVRLPFDLQMVLFANMPIAWISQSKLLLFTFALGLAFIAPFRKRNHSHVGSWTMTVKRLESSKAARAFGGAVTSNPHQVFLLLALGNRTRQTESHSTVRIGA